MAFEQVRDVVERARRFHREMAEFYRLSEDRVEKEKVQLVLDYLSRHEEILDQHLREFEEGADENVLDTWFKYAPNDEIRKVIGTLEVRPDMSVPEVVNMALKLDDAMLCLYRESADLSAVDEVKDVFENLYREGKKEREKMVLAVFGFE